MSKVSLRTCLGCNEVRAKHELLRIVKTSEGLIKIDSTGKINGRGAYLCPEEHCTKEALKGTRIARALKVSPNEINKQVIIGMIQESGSKHDQKRAKK